MLVREKHARVPARGDVQKNGTRSRRPKPQRLRQDRSVRLIRFIPAARLGRTSQVFVHLRAELLDPTRGGPRGHLDVVLGDGVVHVARARIGQAPAQARHHAAQRLRLRVRHGRGRVGGGLRHRSRRGRERATPSGAGEGAGGRARTDARSTCALRGWRRGRLPCAHVCGDDAFGAAEPPTVVFPGVWEKVESRGEPAVMSGRLDTDTFVFRARLTKRRLPHARAFAADRAAPRSRPGATKRVRNAQEGSSRSFPAPRRRDPLSLFF